MKFNGIAKNYKKIGFFNKQRKIRIIQNKRVFCE